MLDTLKNKLIVSCQPVTHGPLDNSDIVAAFALAVLSGGASGLRIEGAANVAAVRAVTSAPIIGLIKRDLGDSPIRITPWLNDIDDLASAGANIIAIDATERTRPVAVPALIQRIHDTGALAMADCSNLADAEAALAAGSDILGSTMSGYTGGPIPSTPDFELVQALAKLGSFVIAEGRYHRPDQATQALQYGADAVVVGTAITRPEHITGWFAEAVAAHNGDQR